MSLSRTIDHIINDYKPMIDKQEWINLPQKSKVGI